jgi:hypothetical protein
MITTIKDAENFLDGFPEIKMSKQEAIQTTRPFSGRNVKNYKGPSQNIINHLQKFFLALDAENHKGITEGMSSLNFVGFRFKEAPGTVYFGANNRSEVAINFFWRFGATVIPGQPETFGNPVDQMMLEAPHEGSDNTFPSSVKMFVNTRARILIGNGVNNHSGSSGGVKCQSNKRYKSDGAHNSETLFNYAHMMMAAMYPDSVFPQIHGMKGGKAMLVVNCTNSHFTDPEKSAAEMLGRACGHVWPNKKQLGDFAFCGNVTGKHADGIAYSKIYRRPKGCHNTTISAHVLNPGGSQCSKGKKDSGRFIHLEFSPAFRMSQFKMYKGNMKNFALALNQLMVIWNEKAGNPNDYKVVKSPYLVGEPTDESDVPVPVAETVPEPGKPDPEDPSDPPIPEDPEPEVPDVIEDDTIENDDDEDVLDENEEPMPEDNVDEEIPDDHVVDPKPEDNVDEEIPDDHVVDPKPEDNVDEEIPDDHVVDPKPEPEESIDDKITRLVEASLKKIIKDMVDSLH